MQQDSQSPTPVVPLPFHLEMLEFLKAEERAIWTWYSEAKQKTAYADALRLELLKTTYRLDKESHGPLHAIGEEASQKLELNVPVTFYQSQGDNSGLNASVCCLPGEAHIVFSGRIMETLNPAELKALVGHELGHFRLRESVEGQLLTAERILDGMAVDERAESSHIASAMRFRQYTEIYADRCAWLVCGDKAPVIGCLVKAGTGLREVSADAYIAQAEEIFSKKDIVTEGMSHPETFIRTRALAKWVNQDPDAEDEIRKMIEGRIPLGTLDLLSQLKLSRLSRRLIDVMLAPKWMRSETALAHARLYFHDYAPPILGHKDESLTESVQSLHSTSQDYCCYLFLDFAAVDPALEELPLVHALTLAESFGLRDRTEELANKELRTTKKALAKLRQDGAELLAKAEQA